MFVEEENKQENAQNGLSSEEKLTNGGAFSVDELNRRFSAESSEYSWRRSPIRLKKRCSSSVQAAKKRKKKRCEAVTSLLDLLQSKLSITSQTSTSKFQTNNKLNKSVNCEKENHSKHSPRIPKQAKMIILDSTITIILKQGILEKNLICWQDDLLLMIALLQLSEAKTSKEMILQKSRLALLKQNLNY